MTDPTPAATPQQPAPGGQGAATDGLSPIDQAWARMEESTLDKAIAGVQSVASAQVQAPPAAPEGDKARPTEPGPRRPDR